MKYKILSLALLLSTTLLSSCGSDAPATASLTKDASTNNYSVEGLMVSAPASWSGTYTLSGVTPREGKFAGAFVSPASYAGFHENLTILSSPYQQSGSGNSLPTQAAYLSRASKDAASSYLSHTLISDKKIVFPDKSEGLVSIFDAQYNEKIPKRRFVQSAKICSGNIYLLTYALSPNGNTDEAVSLLGKTGCK